MTKLIHPDTGAVVTATTAGAALLRQRGYKDYVGSTRSRSSATTPPPPAPVGDGWPDTHAGLDAIADGLDGFAWPAPPEGKKKLTVAEKVEALKAADYTPTPSA